MRPAAALLACVLVLPANALAQQQLAPDPEPWRFTITPYAWALSVSGNVTARNQTIDTNASFIDLVQKSDSIVGFMSYLEASKGRVGVYGDFVFAKLGFGGSQTNYRNPLPALRITTTVGAAVTYQLFIAEMGGLYELYRWPGSDTSSTAIDALLGFRYWNNSIAATFDVTANLNFNYAIFHLDRTFGIAVARADAIQWVDPVIGLRLRHQFTPNQHVFVRGDIGGFGVTGSQFSWQAVAAYSYAWQFTGYQIAAVVGFRALGVNYYNPALGADGIGINEVFYGPIIGASFRF